MPYDRLIPPLPADHPLRAARWIWPEGTYYLHNHYAQFRRVVELATVPEQAPFFITADQCYRLWVNGEHVCRGPARGYQEHWPFDEVDLSPWLKPGRNLIAVLAYTAGCSTFGYRHNFLAGLIAAADWGDVRIATGSDGWQQRRSPGHATDTVRYSMQIAYQEHVDLAQLDEAWLTDPDLPAEFAGPEQDKPQPGFKAMPCHNACWQRLEERGIPLLREQYCIPEQLIGEVKASCAAGWQTTDNPSWFWVGEATALTDNWQQPSAPVQRDDDYFWLSVPATGADGLRAYVLDCGPYRVANDIVRIEGAAGGEVIDLQHDEQRDGLHARYVKPGGACASAMCNRLRCRAGDQQHEFFHHLGHRYLTVIVRGSQQPLRIGIAQRHVGYPFAMRGRFSCSDEELNQLHAACRLTQQICSLDAYVDTPWREQAQWWGDARVQFANTVHLDGDAQLLARGIRSIAAQPGPEGLTFGHAPTMAYNCVLPDFSCTWMLTVRDHWWQTGSCDLVRDFWWRIERVLAYFDQEQVRHLTGLVAYDTRFWYFGDWSKLAKPPGGAPSFLNCWLLYALEQLQPCLEAADMRREATRIAEHATRLRKLIEAHLVRDGLVIGALDADGKVVDSPSQHDQVMALLLGLKGVDQERVERQVLHPWLEGEDPAPFAEVSPFWCYYLLKEMSRRGHGQAVIDCIRRRWQPMLTTGTTWEFWNNDETVSHAWTSHPAEHLPAVLCGIRQTGVAWRGVDIAPCFATGIDQADAMVPTPQGDLSVSWQRKGEQITVTVDIPESQAATLRLPGREPQVLSPGSHQLRC